MRARQVPQAAFTLTEIMIVVAIIGLLAVIAIPAFAKSRAHSAQTMCISNLRHIDEAKAQWALDTRRGLGVRPRNDNLFGPTLYLRTKPQCPAGGQYDLGKIKEPPTCTVAGHTLPEESSTGGSTRDPALAFDLTPGPAAIAFIAPGS